MNDLFLLMVICFVAMVSPGPDFILVTRNSLLYPRVQAFATALGIISGCILHATYCVLGLAFVITKSILVFSIIKYAGACYLIYLGVKGLVFSGGAESNELPKKKQNISIKSAFMQGFLCNLLNPKLAVFLLSLFTQFIPPNATLYEKIAVAGIFVIESAIYWPLIVIIFQWKSIKIFFERFQRHIDKLFGALLIAIGIRVVLTK